MLLESSGGLAQVGLEEIEFSGLLVTAQDMNLVISFDHYLIRERLCYHFHLSL
jgi:hypothetical protein